VAGFTEWIAMFQQLGARSKIANGKSSIDRRLVMLNQAGATPYRKGGRPYLREVAGVGSDYL
jgi:hypothetical protein